MIGVCAEVLLLWSFFTYFHFLIATTGSTHIHQRPFFFSSQKEFWSVSRKKLV
jgi:hypothetical protein